MPQILEVALLVYVPQSADPVLVCSSPGVDPSPVFDRVRDPANRPPSPGFWIMYGCVSSPRKTVFLGGKPISALQLADLLRGHFTFDPARFTITPGAGEGCKIELTWSGLDDASVASWRFSATGARALASAPGREPPPSAVTGVVQVREGVVVSVEAAAPISSALFFQIDKAFARLSREPADPGPGENGGGEVSG